MTLGPYIAKFCNQETKKKQWEGINSTGWLLLRLAHELDWDLRNFDDLHIQTPTLFEAKDDGVGNGNGQHPLRTIFCSARISVVRQQIAILQICISLFNGHPVQTASQISRFTANQRLPGSQAVSRWHVLCICCRRGHEHPLQRPQEQQHPSKIGLYEPSRDPVALTSFNGGVLETGGQLFMTENGIIL